MSTTPHHDHPAGEVHDHDLGLAHDLPRLISRRRALGVIGGGVGLVLAGCSSDDEATTSAATQTTPTEAATTETTSGDTAAVPEETAGPYPGDGSNGPNVLTESGVVRQDITKSFGDASGVADGVPTTLDLTLIDVAGGGGPLAGAAIYLWHCDIERRLLALRRSDRQRELPARRTGVRRRRQDQLQDDLPGRLLGALAAHPLRDLREPRFRDRRRAEAAHLADRDPRGHLQRGLRDERLRAERHEPRAVLARRRHGLQRRLRRASWRPPRGSAADGVTLSLNIGV